MSEAQDDSYRIGTELKLSLSIELGLEGLQNMEEDGLKVNEIILKGYIR